MIGSSAVELWIGLNNINHSRRFESCLIILTIKKDRKMKNEAWRKKSPHDKMVEKGHYGYPPRIEKGIPYFSDRKYKINPKTGSWARLN